VQDDENRLHGMQTGSAAHAVARNWVDFKPVRVRRRSTMRKAQA
jgi:hypothetical protein